MKVRGYQVAPAELEGHLLDHPDVSDVCVVGVPDEYSGEVPMAFVCLNPQAAEALNKDPVAETTIKESIIKVRSRKKRSIVLHLIFLCSTSRKQRSRTNG